MISQEQFTDELLVQRCERILRERSESLVQILWVTSWGDFTLTKPSHLDSEYWLKEQSRGARTRIYAAELIVLNGDAVLRIRDGLAVRSRVLRRKDPLTRVVSGTRFDILHISVSSGFWPVSVFVKTASTLSVARSNELFIELGLSLGRGLYLVIRPDHWFSGELDFPMYYWYDVRPTPDFRHVASAPQITCALYREGEPPCTGIRLP